MTAVAVRRVRSRRHGPQRAGRAVEPVLTATAAGAVHRQSESAPGPIRTADLSLRRYGAQEAKEAQKWLWQARCAAGWRRLIPADMGRFGRVWATEGRRWPKRLGPRCDILILRHGGRIARYPDSAMATRKINLMLDEDLIRLARRQDIGAAGKSDVQVVEDALAVFLGLRALDEARAQGTLAAEDADRLAVQEVRAVRRARSRA